MVEPPRWFDAPMNESIKEYARYYVSPVKQYHLTLEDAARAWGTHEGLTDVSV
jgi:hypothetical protein